MQGLKQELCTKCEDCMSGFVAADDAAAVKSLWDAFALTVEKEMAGLVSTIIEKVGGKQ